MVDFFTLKGDINSLTAATFSGTVTATASQRFQLGNSEYPVVPITVNLNAQGEYTIPGLVLPDSPNVSPADFTYRLNFAVTVTPADGTPAKVDAWQVDVVVTSDLLDGSGVVEYSKLPRALVPGRSSPFLSKAQVLELIGNIDGGTDLEGIADAFTDADSVLRQATDDLYATPAQAQSIAQTATSGVIAPIQTAVNEARKGVVDGAFGISIGIHDAAQASLYASQNPAAEYDPVTNRTYISYLSTENRALAIRYFDHASGTFSAKQYIGEYLIANNEDTHGAPSMAIDQNARRIIITYGVHNENLAVARSGTNLDINTWTLSRPAFPSSYGHAAYDDSSKATYIMFRAGSTHVGAGSTAPSAHEVGRIVKSVDGGATWAEVIGARVNTKLVYPSDIGTDYYGSDFDAYNGRLYMSFSIAHAPAGSGDPHDGARAGAYVCYLDPSDGKLHAVDGQVIDLYTAPDDFIKARITTGDYTYPIKTAVAPNGNIVTSFNKYDSTVNYVRNYSAYWDGLKWTVNDTSTYSNYVYNGTSVQYRVINGIGTWELIAIRNVNGDNVVATSDQKDTLGGASNGGDVVKLKSTDGLTFTVDATWDAERFTTPITYVQAVRYAQPGLLFLLQGVSYSTIPDVVDGSRGTGNIGSYNGSDHQSEIFFMYASTNLPAVLNISRRPEVQFNLNPIFKVPAAGRVALPTAWTKLSISPTPLPRGTRSVRLRVACVVTAAAAGRVLVQFRQSGSNRDSDDEVTFNGNVTYGQIATVDVPVGADGAIEWMGTADAGITVTVGSTIRSFRTGSQRLLSKSPKTGIAKAASATITIPGAASPSAPSALSLSATPADSQVTLLPSGGSGQTSYALYRGTDATGILLTNSYGTFVDGGRTNGTAINYYAIATNAQGSVTATATATPSGAVVVPTADTLSATAGAIGSNAITVSGTGGSNIASRALYRSTTSTVDTTGTAIATALPFTDNGRTPGLTYFYQEKVTSSTGATATSAVVSAVGPAASSGGGGTSTTDGFTTTSSAGIPTWTRVQDADLVLVNADGAKLNGTGATATTAYYIAPSQVTSADQFCRVVPFAVGGTSRLTTIAAIRVTNNTTSRAITDGYTARWNGTSLKVELFRIAAGVTTALTPTTGADLGTMPTSLELRGIGSTIGIYINGSSTPLYSVTDTGVTSIGQVAIGFRYTASADNSTQARSATWGNV